VVWESFGQDGDSAGIFGQRYDVGGRALDEEFQINSYTTGTQRFPSVAMDAGGNFVVVWADYDQGGDLGIFARRYAATGRPHAGEFQVHSYTSGVQTQPSVAMNAAGDFVVVWQGDDADGDGYGIVGQRYDAAGLPHRGEFRVNSYISGRQYEPVVTMDAGGNFAVAWSSSSPDGTAPGIFGRMFDAAAAPRGDDFLVDSYIDGAQSLPSIAGASDGTFVVAWTSANYEGGAAQDGHRSGVFAQRFSPDADLIFSDGFESGNLAAWSAAATDGGDASVSATAGLNFSVAGLRGVVDDTAGLYVQDDTPDDESRYRARFYFDPNSFDPGEAQNHFRTRLFIAFEENPARRLVAIVLRRIAGQYRLMGRARLDDNSQYNTGFFPISNDSHFVELEWNRSSGADAEDGSFELWIDGESVHAATVLDNSISAVDFVRLGALSVKPGADGTVYWDEFESRRATYIGP
jgi:hypothetical protein